MTSAKAVRFSGGCLLAISVAILVVGGAGGHLISAVISIASIASALSALSLSKAAAKAAAIADLDRRQRALASILRLRLMMLLSGSVAALIALSTLNH